MKLKDYATAEDIAEAIKQKIFTYQYIMNQSSRFSKEHKGEFNIYKEACKVYSNRKKAAIAELLKEW